MEIMETIQATADVSRGSWETISREGEIVWHHGASRGAGNSGKAAGGFTIKQLLQVLPRRVEQEFGSWLLETFINPKSGR